MQRFVATFALLVAACGSASTRDVDAMLEKARTQVESGTGSRCVELLSRLLESLPADDPRRLDASVLLFEAACVSDEDLAWKTYTGAPREERTRVQDIAAFSARASAHGNFALALRVLDFARPSVTEADHVEFDAHEASALRGAYRLVDGTDELSRAATEASLARMANATDADREAWIYAEIVRGSERDPGSAVTLIERAIERDDFHPTSAWCRRVASEIAKRKCYALASFWLRRAGARAIDRSSENIEAERRCLAGWGSHREVLGEALDQKDAHESDIRSICGVQPFCCEFD